MYCPSSSVLGTLLLVMLWGGIAAKYFDNRASDLNGAKRDNENFALLFEENVLRSLGEMDKALLYLRRTLETANAPLDLHAVVGTSDVPEWVAVDVCDCMGIDNVSRAVSDFDDDEKGIRNLHTLGGKQTLITLYESGL